jgi:hypothetical protein
MDCNSRSKATSVALPSGYSLPVTCGDLCNAMEMKLHVPVLQPGDHELMFSRWVGGWVGHTVLGAP